MKVSKQKTDEELAESIRDLLGFVKEHCLELNGRGYRTMIMVNGTGGQVLDITEISFRGDKTVNL